MDKPPRTDTFFPKTFIFIFFNRNLLADSSCVRRRYNTHKRFSLPVKSAIAKRRVSSLRAHQHNGVPTPQRPQLVLSWLSPDTMLCGLDCNYDIRLKYEYFDSGSKYGSES